MFGDNFCMHPILNVMVIINEPNLGFVLVSCVDIRRLFHIWLCSATCAVISYFFATNELLEWKTI